MLCFRLQNFYLSSSADNCQLTGLEVDKALSTDLNADSSWNIYERRFSGSCDSYSNGNGGGGGGTFNPSGKNIKGFILCFWAYFSLTKVSG